MTSKKSDNDWLQELADMCGLSEDEMFEKAILDSIADGICVECGYTCEVEPDCEFGYCEACNNQTVKSCLVLARLI